MLGRQSFSRRFSSASDRLSWQTKYSVVDADTTSWRMRGRPALLVDPFFSLLFPSILFSSLLLSSLLLSSLLECECDVYGLRYSTNQRRVARIDLTKIGRFWTDMVRLTGDEYLTYFGGGIWNLLDYFRTTFFFSFLFPRPRRLKLRMKLDFS